MQTDKIKIPGYRGTWYVVEEDVFHRPLNNGTTEDIPVYFLEHETYGDETAWICVDDDLNVVLDDVWNGKDDLREYEDMLEWQKIERGFSYVI